MPKVYVRCNVSRLSEIDAVEQSFCVKFQIEFKMSNVLYVMSFVSL